MKILLCMVIGVFALGGIVLGMEALVNLIHKEPAPVVVEAPVVEAVPCDCDEMLNAGSGHFLGELVEACYAEGGFHLQYTDPDGTVGTQLFYCTPASVSDKA